MIRYDYMRADTLPNAAAAAAQAGAKLIAGGTNLVDLLKYDVERPTQLIDITRLPGLDTIAASDRGGLRIGALVSNSDVAYSTEIEQRYPLLSLTILNGATPQLRNAATTGGNLLQRTRCYYFYDTAAPCNKRQPGSGCGAIGGVNRIHAVLGASPSCIATNPSDMNVALAALEAVIHVQGPNGERSIPIADFHRLPGDTPERDTTLQPGEIVTAVELLEQGFATHYTYLKLRDRLSYAFALVSVAVGLAMDGGTVKRARIALGGVAHKPWRVPEAEALLEGQAPGEAVFRRVAARIMEGAVGQGTNDFKIPLATKAIIRALQQAAAGTPQSVSDKRIA